MRNSLISLPVYSHVHVARSPRTWRDSNYSWRRRASLRFRCDNLTECLRQMSATVVWSPVLWAHGPLVAKGTTHEAKAMPSVP
jgi:hypothetical protein